MKTLLTLFVLLFSSSVISDEGLVGKQLICERNNDRFVSLRGIEFLDEENIIMVTGTYQVDSKINLSWGEIPYRDGESFDYIVSTDKLRKLINYEYEKNSFETGVLKIINEENNTK